MPRPARNLANALDDAEPAQAAPITVEQPTAAPRAARGPKSREGKSLVGGHLPDRYRRTLRILAAETDETTEKLLQEALDMLFLKKGVK